MIQVFIVCHEGEVPYVVRGLQEVLQEENPRMQLVSQGSTQKMYMGYVLLEGEGEISPACLAELRANPDIYFYAVHDPDAQDEESDEEDGEEDEAAEEPAYRA